MSVSNILPNFVVYQLERDKYKLINVEISKVGDNYLVEFLYPNESYKNRALSFLYMIWRSIRLKRVYDKEHFYFHTETNELCFFGSYANVDNYNDTKHDSKNISVKDLIRDDVSLGKFFYRLYIVNWHHMFNCKKPSGEFLKEKNHLIYIVYTISDYIKLKRKGLNVIKAWFV